MKSNNFLQRFTCGEAGHALIADNHGASGKYILFFCHWFIPYGFKNVVGVFI
jgi:hypothetical protein